MKARFSRLVDAMRSIDPLGAAAIFAPAWIAGYAGSLTAAFVAAAYLGGLYAVRFSAPAAARVVVGPPALPVAAPAAAAAPSVTDALTAGLAVSRVEFKQPASVNGSRRKSA